MSTHFIHSNGFYTTIPSNFDSSLVFTKLTFKATVKWNGESFFDENTMFGFSDDFSSPKNNISFAWDDSNGKWVARVEDNDTPTDVDIDSSMPAENTFTELKIEIELNKATFFIDNVQVAQHTTGFPRLNMRVMFLLETGDSDQSNFRVGPVFVFYTERP